MNRALLAGILGGIVMFIWTAIAHMVLPLGEAGVSKIGVDNESALLDAMKTNLGDRRGLFIFPAPNVGPNATRQEKNDAMKQMADKATNGPSGILMYHPTRPFTFGKWLGVEFATELLESILVVCLLAQTRLTTFGGRVSFVTTAGILAAIATNVSYWNWYGFPKRYTAAYMFIEIVGFLLIGIVAALVLKKNAGQTIG
jgi:hypothetical protein